MGNLSGLGQMFRSKAGVMAMMTLAGTAAFVGTEFGKLISGEKTKTERVFDYAKNEFNTYQAIKKEGIKADSYGEAKQKLDSVYERRLFIKYGIEPPAENASTAEKLNKQLELQIKLNEESESCLRQLLRTIDSIDATVK